MNTDYLIVGAGLAGLVLAERLSSQLGRRCIVIDQRNHIGGNCYDEYDHHGVLVHRYGPHYFRTNSPRISEYLSKFTAWRQVTYKVLSYSDERYWSFPINLRTYGQMMERTDVTEAEFEAYLRSKRVPIAMPCNSEEQIISQVGWELYERFFKGYTIKQWRRHPAELSASVCGRIPVRTNSDDRYFADAFQALPAAGYTRMFENMVDASPGVKIFLRTSLNDVAKEINWAHMIYSGPIDEYFDLRFGALPYRSLRFERQHYTQEDLAALNTDWAKKGYFQPEMQVNYPNKQEYTRIVEIKHATGQRCSGTTIVREFPEDYRPGFEPYYPIPTPESDALYRRYAALAERESRVTFVGRLGTYKYYNMDQIVGMALSKFDLLAQRDSVAQHAIGQLVRLAGKSPKPVGA